MSPRLGWAAFEGLGGGVIPVRTPIGEAWILTDDEPVFRTQPGRPAKARLLPSGDAYFLLQGSERELLVPEPVLRTELWTPRVWPGAVLVSGEAVGTWRRAGPVVSITAWRPLSAEARDAVESEAQSFPLPDVAGGIRVRWTV
jgi:hypothetical protein